MTTGQAGTPHPPHILDAPLPLEQPLAGSAEEQQRAEDRHLHSSLAFSRKGALTLACLAAFVAIPYAHPAMSRFRVLTPKAPKPPQAAPAIATPINSAIGEASLPGATEDSQDRAKELFAKPKDARGPIAARGVERPANIEKNPGNGKDIAFVKPPRSIEDPSGHALDHYFSKLMAVDAKKPGSQAKILYFGDSIVGSDFVTGKLRRMLQTRFGDAGHGYALLANAWPGWFHLDVSRTASANWKASRVIGPFAKDGLYGLGGVSFQATQPDAWAKFATSTTDDWGQKVSRYQIEYLKQPGGGDFRIIVDGKDHSTLKTAADEPTYAVHTVKLPDGAHSLELRSVDTRPVRAFGMRMERDVQGVTLSALGITGARARFLDKSDDAHWAQALKASDADLVVLAFGSNEATDGLLYPMDKYEATLLAVMKQVTAAMPGKSLMLVGPPDMASKVESSHSRTVLPVLIRVQRKLAKQEGWAYWDQYLAMGGAGSMWKWIKLGLGSHDMFHPTGIGGNQLGTWQFHATMEAYNKYKAAHGSK